MFQIYEKGTWTCKFYNFEKKNKKKTGVKFYSRLKKKGGGGGGGGYTAEPTY